MDEWLIEHLACPRDHDQLELDGGTILRCPSGHAYPCVDGVPVLLLDDVEPTHSQYTRSLEQARETVANSPEEVNDIPVVGDTVDPFVQGIVSGTGGNLYKPLTGKLVRYPIPELPLPPATGQHFLDVGCNWGRWSLSAARKGYSCVGIDVSLDAIMSARRVSRQLGHSPLFLVADARFLPFKPNSFEVVFSYSVLQHFSKADVRRCLPEFDRVLNSPGRSLIQMPNRFGFLGLWNQAKQKLSEPGRFHVRYWGPWELRHTFRDAIGPTALAVDGYFSLGIGEVADRASLRMRHRIVVMCSDLLRRASKAIPWMTWLADSLYVESTHLEQGPLKENLKPSAGPAP